MAKDQCPIFNGITLLDHDFFQDPNPTYQELRDEHPIAIDPKTGFYLITRFDDVRDIVMDPATYSSAEWMEVSRETLAGERAKRNQQLFATKGWTYEPNVGIMDDPRHKEVRRLFDNALRAMKVKEMETDIAAVADELLGAIKPGEEHEIIHALGTPLPLIVICNQVGAPRADVWKIKAWCTDIFDRASFNLTEEEEVERIEREIDAQHYFMELIEKLRKEPDGTVLSDMVNARMSDGKQLSDGEALNNLLYTIFVAGSETTTFAIGGAFRWLCERPELFTTIKAAVAKGSKQELANFVEEILRLESPSSGSWRITTKDVELHGTKIPMGSVLHIRFGAANLDDRRFECPHELDLNRPSPRKHLAFGSGIHVCVGAALARTEMNMLFERVFARYDGVEFAEPEKPVAYHDHYGFKSISQLRVRFQ